MSEKDNSSEPDGRTNFNTRHAKYQHLASDTYQDIHSRCPGSGGGLSGNQFSHDGHSVHTDFEGVGGEDTGVSVRRNLQGNVSSATSDGNQRPIKYPANVLSVVFHLYVHRDAEKATIEFETPPRIYKNVTLDLECVSDDYHGKYWKSRPVTVNLDDNVRYRYIVRYHQGTGKKVINLIKSFVATVEYDVKETGYKRTVYPGENQYDIFKEPKNSYYNECVFAGQFFFVKMLYDSVREDGTNLKETMIECEHVGFGHASFTRSDRENLLLWVMSLANQLNPPKSAYVCAVLAQFLKKIGFLINLNYGLRPYIRETDPLLFHLRRCSKQLLPSSALAFIKSIDMNLLEASSYKSNLGYILNFAHLFDDKTVVDAARSLGPVIKADDFDRISAEIIKMLPDPENAEKRSLMLEFVVSESPSVDSLWKLCRQLEGRNLLTALIETAVNTFHRFFTRARKPDLLETPVWNDVPNALKPKLAEPFCDAVIEQLNKTSHSLNHGILKDLILDKDLQNWATTSVVKLLSLMASHGNKGLPDVTCEVLNAHNFHSFWENTNLKYKEEIIQELVLNMIQARQSKSYTSKEKVVSAFQVLQELNEIRAIKQCKELMESIGKYICQETQRLGLKPIVDAYDDIQSHSKEIAKKWYMILLTLTVEQRRTCRSDVKQKLIDVVRSSGSFTSSSKSIEIDGGREELLLMLVNQANLPKGKEDIDKSVHKVIRSVLSDKEMWSVIFQASGKTDRLHGHRHYSTVKKAISWLRDALMNGTIPLDFLKSKKDEDDVAQLLALARCSTGGDQRMNESLFQEWQEKLASLSKQGEKIHGIFVDLKHAIDLVERVSQDKALVSFGDFEDIYQEYNDRKNRVESTSFADFRKESYWGPLTSLIRPAASLRDLTSSLLFVNFAVKVIEEEITTKKQTDDDKFFVEDEDYLEDIQSMESEDVPSGSDPNSMTVEQVLILLAKDGVAKFDNVFEKIFKMQVSSPEIDVLFSGVSQEELDRELELVARFFRRGRPPDSIVQMLHNYARYEDIKERIQKALKCLYAQGYETSSEFIQRLESFLKCKESGTLESISKRVVSMKYLDMQLKPALVDILSELSEATELSNFIIKTAKDNMVDLVDAVEEHSDQLIQESMVSDLIDVHRFLSDLLSNKPDDPERFLDQIAKAHESLTKDHSSIPKKPERTARPRTKMAAKIKVCSSNVHSLRGLYMTLSNRGELTKEIIKSAVNDGCYQIGITDNGKCEVLLTYTRKGQANAEAKYNMDELNDLRSRALLIVNADKPNNGEVEREVSIITSEELNQFIEQVDLVTEITRKYDALRRSGIPKYGKSRWVKMKSIDEIMQEAKQVEEKLAEWNYMLQDLRENHFFLNYFHATQIWELRSFFQKAPSAKMIPGKVLALFRCIDNQVNKEDLPSFQSKYKPPKRGDIQDELEAIGSALDEIFKISQQKPLPVIASTKKMDAIVEPGKLYVSVLEPGSAQTVHVIVVLFLNTCASLPKPSQLLFCHSQTTWEEIELFLSRTFDAHSHGLTCKLHCLANVESLPNDIQFQLVDNLKRLTDQVKSPYLLAVVCRGGPHHHIADQFVDKTHYFGGIPDPELRERFKHECPSTYFVTSDLPGLGKSEEVFSHAAEKGLSLVNFPISGPFSRKYLVDRLCDLQLKKFQALHFDIGEVDDPNALDTFLFELVVTGMVSSEARLFSLPTNHIYVEIANTLQQKMRDSLPICKCFQKLPVNWKDCSNLVCSTELTSPVQVVCQYLKAYDSGTLESQEVLFSGPNQVKPLSSSDCKALLSKHFFSGEDLSFNILENFISVLADQLMKFTRSPYFKPKNLVDMVGKSHDVRVRLFKALLEVATSFAARSIATCKATQAEALTEEQARDALKKMKSGAEATAAEMVDRVEGMIQWSDNEHLVIMLHGAGAVTAIYRDLEKVPQGVKDLFQSQSIKGKGKGLEDYRSMSQEELQERLERISDAHEKPDKVELQSLGYALTPDNILKMVLIIQRMQANIPVIIMGETGCGKTSLVQYLAKTCNTPFCVFNFHAGITEKQLTEFISSKDKQARALQKENKSLWVFLDEINTCDYLGTVNEIVCHRCLHGKPLAPNLVFVAACNPYRLRSSGQIMTAGLGGKTSFDEYSKLVYRVHPLPETMIDYVWDYGALSEKDEKAYIGRMVEGLFDAKFNKLLVELLAASQDFIRTADESSFCVSLRDVHRTTILIKWFYNMLKIRPAVYYSERPLLIQKYFITAQKFDLEDRSIVLALAHCYLSRIPSTDLRKSYCKEMTKIFEKNGRYMFSVPIDGFEQIIRAEQEEWLLRMELPPGTARNAALRENVFVILVCILNRMPVFVVGKPGCSKSLSMQVIRSNLRGRDSKDDFLKTLPQLYVVSFQGSESSTSEGIEKVFEKAKKYKEKAENVLPVVMLDEIGLAEVSKFNPLKVLHRLLEPGKGQFPDVAVVGISNWALDAAKMNRAVHLSRPEPDEEDLYETGLSIRELQINRPGGRSGLRSETRCKNQLKCLAEAYHQYQSKQKHKNFHGLRDYYSMVKCLETSATKPDQNNESIHRAMQRNFGGLSKEKGEFQKLFLEKLEKSQATEDVSEFPVTELIQDNLHDKLARHLMIITNGDSAIGILDQTLADLNKEKITIFGSRFEEDLSADYNHRVLSRIILCMEQNCVLILRDLEGIYGSLYDMLNQNYIVVGGKKNCRIALGAFSNPMCQVDDGFRCIVLVDENKVDYSDPPFLNRFEKQLLRFSDVLDVHQTEIIEELREWVQNISTVTGFEKEFSEVDMFAGYHGDTLPSLVLLHSQDQDGSAKEDVMTRCKDDLMLVAMPDAVIRARKSRLHQSNDEEVNELYREYFEKPIHEGLKVYLRHSVDTQDMDSKKLLVMTHSSVHTDVSKCVDEDIFNVQTEKLSFFKSEKELSKRIQYFWKESKANLLVVQCRPNSDAPHMLLVKSTIEQQRKEYLDSSQSSESPKHVCIVIHLQREAKSEEDQRSYRWPFNFLSGWRQVMIDVLEAPVIQIKEILESSIEKVLDSGTMPFDKVAADQLLWCFTRIKYPPLKQPELKDTIALVDSITSSATIMEGFRTLCFRWIREDDEDNSKSGSRDAWQVSVACDRKALMNCSTLVKAMQYFVTHLLRRPLTRIVYFLQKQSAWKSMIECGEMTGQECVKLLLMDSVFNIHDVPDPQDAESLVVSVSHQELQYPFSCLFFQRVDGLYEFFSEEYRRESLEEDALDENGEMHEVAKKSVIVRVSRKVQQVITEILDSDYLVHHIQDYVDDALDIVSEEFCRQLTRDDRVRILKAHFVDHLSDPTSGGINDIPFVITQLHSLLWLEGNTIPPLLHFIGACIPRVPMSVDDLINKFNDMKSEAMKTDELPYKEKEELPEDDSVEDVLEVSNQGDTSGKESGEEEETEMEELNELTKTKKPEEHDEQNPANTGEDSNLNLPIQDSLKNKNKYSNKMQGSDGAVKTSPTMEDEKDDSAEKTLEEHDSEKVDEKNYDGSSPQTKEDDNQGESTQEIIDIEEDPDEDQGDESDGDEDQSEHEDDNDERIETKDEEAEEEEETTFDDFVVQEICSSLFPNDELIQSFGGIAAWRTVTTFVLSTATRFHLQVPAFHYLKVCHDLSTLFQSLPEAIAFSLYALGDLASIVKEKNYLDSIRIFELICKCIDDLKEDGEDEEKLDEFLFLFYARCIESNPDTPLMSEILKQISFTDDEKFLQLAVPILYSIFCSEKEAFSDEHFEKVIDSLDGLEEFPNLIEVNEALKELQISEITELDRHFNVICCDLINRMAFKKLDLTTVSTSDHPVLKAFHKALRILSELAEDEASLVTFGTICAVSFLRAFIFALARFLIEQRNGLAKYDHLLSEIFKELNEELPSMKGNLNLLLIKELRQRVPLYEVAQLVESCERLDPLKKIVSLGTTPPKKIDCDPFQSYADKSETEIALGKHVAGSNSKPLDDILSSIVVTAKRRMELAAVVFEQFYLVRTFRNLKDTEDKAVKYITDKLTSVTDPYKRFLLRISSQESFTCSQLEVNAETKATDVEVAVLIHHLSAIITSRFSGKSKNPVVCCLIDPTVMSDSYILAAPADTSGYGYYQYFDTTRHQSVLFFSCCTCGTRFATREGEPTLKCFGCGSTCEGEAMKDEDAAPAAQKGYFYCQPESMHDEMLSTRNLDPVEFRILHLIIHVALFAGYNLDLTKDKLSKFMKVENPSEVCFHYIQDDLDVLSAIFCCTKDRIIAFLHHIIAEATTLLTENSGLPLPHDEKTRLSWESYFSKLVKPLVKKFRENDLKPRNKACDAEDEDASGGEEQIPGILIEEVEEPQFSVIAPQTAFLPRLFRTKHQNTFEKLREFYLNSSEEVKESHQLLGLFLDYHKTLSRIGNLVALNAWSRRVDVLLSRSLTKADAKESKIGDAVIRKVLQLKGIDAKSEGAESVRNAFREFSKAWENVLHLFNDDMKEDYRRLSELSPVGLCLVERQGLGKYLCAALAGLAHMQNEFLDKCLAIAASGKCPALQFLWRNGAICSFPSIHVQDAKEREIIQYKWMDKLLDHSRYNLEYGHGTEIIYDIAKIEKNIAGLFLLGKAYLTNQNDLREFVFSKHLFHDCANILNDLESAIPQTELPRNVEMELGGSIGKSLDDNQVLMEHMEIVLCFLKRTGGKPEESLLDYVKTWMTASRPFPKHLLPKSQDAIQLRHVCALYVFLEDQFAEKAIDCVGDEYREVLPDSIKGRMDDNGFLQDENRAQNILKATVTAIKRFIFRYLSMKPSGNRYLLEFMEDLSLWPISMRAKNDHIDIREVIPTLFPNMLTIEHAFEAHKYYQDRLDKQRHHKHLNRTDVRTRVVPCKQGKTKRRGNQLGFH